MTAKKEEARMGRRTPSHDEITDTPLDSVIDDRDPSNPDLECPVIDEGDAESQEGERPNRIKEVEKLQREEEAQLARDREHEYKKKKQDFILKSVTAGVIFILVCGWIIFVVYAIYCHGAINIPFWISDKVLIALLSTTTINVVGLLYVVVKYFFPQGGPPNSQ